jgi:phytoene synthase
MTPQQYCRDKAAKSGSSFYYSFMFLPKQQREAITALYAFCREVDDAVDEIDDPKLAQQSLNEWREEVVRFCNKQAKHPVGLALQEAREHFDLHQEYFLEIIDGMEMDLQQQRYPAFKHLALYCHRVASVVGLLSVEIFGYQQRKTLNYAEKLGMALQLINIIRDVREDAQRGRIYLPLEDMQRFGVTEQQLLNLEDSAELTQLLEFETQRARSYYDEAMQLLPKTDRFHQRTGLIMAAIYRATLDEIEAHGYKVMKGRVSLSALRKLWLAWQTSRQERRLAKQ